MMRCKLNLIALIAKSFLFFTSSFKCPIKTNTFKDLFQTLYGSAIDPLTPSNRFFFARVGRQFGTASQNLFSDSQLSQFYYVKRILSHKNGSTGGLPLRRNNEPRDSRFFEGILNFYVNVFILGMTFAFLVELSE